MASGRSGGCWCLSHDLGAEKCYLQLFCGQCAGSWLQLLGVNASDSSSHDFACQSCLHPRPQLLEKMLLDRMHLRAAFHLQKLTI